jgi:hypothetical protein
LIKFDETHFVCFNGVHFGCTEIDRSGGVGT